MSRILLFAEFSSLFVVVPLAFHFSSGQIPPFPLLWGAVLYCLWILRSDVTFANVQLWNSAAIPGQLPSILAVFVLLGSLVMLSIHWIAPGMAFDMVRHHPRQWAVVMVLYPILSVYPQGIIYRAFLIHRYAPVVREFFPDRMATNLSLILLSATCFAFMHVIFRNPVAVTFTFIGGLLFAWRYLVTRSLAASSVEHALYGCLLFTGGLGQFFYHGRIQLH